MHLITAFLVFLVGCNSAKKAENWEHLIIKANCEEIRKEPFVEKGNIKRDIPEFFANPDNGDMRCIEELLGIYTLRNGYDSLEIRIWGTEAAFSFNDRLIRIRHAQGAYVGELYKVKIINKEVRSAANPNLISYPPDSLIVSKRNLGTPQSGWPLFMQRLEEMGVYDLPDYEEVVGYSTGGTDEGWQWVEYATKEKYRHYNYPFPGIYEKAGAERKQFEGIIRFIENEFDISH